MVMPEAQSANEALVGWDEFVALEDDDSRELADGRLVELEVPDLPHERAVAALVEHLRRWAREHDRSAHVLASGYKVRLAEHRGVMPDVQVVGVEALAEENRHGLRTAPPRLVVEVVSPSSRRYDRVIKLGWYAEARVPEYWIVDPEAHTVERLVLATDRYVIAQTASDGSFAPDGYEGLGIPLSELFPEPAGG